MSKPDDIPQDVWDLAKERLAVEYDTGNAYPSYAQISRDGRGEFTECSIRAIARAIMAEREAILALVRQYIWDEHALAQATDVGRACHHQSVEIETAIRNRSSKP